MLEKNNKVIVVLFILALGISLVFIIMSAQQLSMTDNESLNRVAQGKAIYKIHCASCHGENLEGQPNWKTRNEQGMLPAPPYDETGHTWHHADELLFELTKYGMVPPNIPEGYESDMPGFEGVLPDDDIWAVLEFIKSHWPKDIQRSQREMSLRSSSFQKP